MTTVHVGYSNDTEAEYELSHFESMLFAEQLPEDAIYWMEGMEDWQSIADYIPTAREIDKPVSRKVNDEPDDEDRFSFGSGDESDDSSTNGFGGRSRSKRKGYRYVNNPKWLTRILVMMIIGTVGLLIADAWLLVLFRDPINGHPKVLLKLVGQAQLVQILSWVAIVASGLVFFGWLFRASDNSHGFGARGMQYSPGWAVGSWFIPIANFVWPYQAIKEIYLVSRDPKNWKKDNLVSIVEFWWIIRMFAACLAAYFGAMSGLAKTQQEIQALVPLAFTCSGLAFFRICLEVTMILTIARQQDKLVNPEKYDKEQLTAIELDV